MYISMRHLFSSAVGTGAISYSRCVAKGDYKSVSASRKSAVPLFSVDEFLYYRAERFHHVRFAAFDTVFHAVS